MVKQIFLKVLTWWNHWTPYSWGLMYTRWCICVVATKADRIFDSVNPHESPWPINLTCPVFLIKEFAIMSESIDPLSREMGSVIHFQKVQIDLNCTPAKNEKKKLRITVETQFPLTSKLMIGSWWIRQAQFTHELDYFQPQHMWLDLFFGHG